MPKLPFLLRLTVQGKPVVVLVNSGGAATAIHAYVTEGISEVDPKFKKMEPKLKSIKKLHEAYDGKLLTFFEIDEETQATSGSVPDLSTSLLEAIVKMMKTCPDFKKLPEGASVQHPQYGRGRITAVHADGTQSVAFSDSVTGCVRRFGDLKDTLKDVAGSDLVAVRAATGVRTTPHRSQSVSVVASGADGIEVAARPVWTGGASGDSFRSDIASKIDRANSSIAAAAAAAAAAVEPGFAVDARGSRYAITVRWRPLLALSLTLTLTITVTLTPSLTLTLSLRLNLSLT